MARGDQVRAVGTEFLRQRPWIVGPLMVAALVVMVQAGAPARQLAAAGSGMCAMLAFFVFEAWRGRTRLVTETQLLVSLVVTQIGIGFACLATGGVRSPVVVMLFAPTGVGFASFGRARASRAMLVSLIAIAAAVAFAPSPFAELPILAQRILLVAAAADAALLLYVGVSSLAHAYVTAREDVLLSAETRARELESMGAKVAHEIKNPLASVRGLVELMVEDPVGERTAKRLAVVRGEVERIDTIVKDYLSFTKPLSALSPERFDVAELARDVAALAEPRVKLEGESLAVVADRRRVREALVNLVLNALEAGAGRVDLSWKRRGDQVVLELADDGRGMEAAELARVGTPFFTTRAGGTGLGVVLARQVAEQHGGALTFQSEPGRGTRATLILRCTES